MTFPSAQPIYPVVRREVQWVGGSAGEQCGGGGCTFNPEQPECNTVGVLGDPCMWVAFGTFGKAYGGSTSVHNDNKDDNDPNNHDDGRVTRGRFAC